MIYLQLALSFLQVGLFSIGGGYAAIPLIQGQVAGVHSWLTLREFTDLVTIAEMTPGPIAVNAATFVGIRVAGIGGAIVATLSCILPSLIIVSLLSYLYQRYRTADTMQTILSCLRPAVVALIASAALTMLTLVVFGSDTVSLANINWLGAVLFAAALIVLRVKKWHPVLVMLLCGVVNLAVYVLGGIG